MKEIVHMEANYEIDAEDILWISGVHVHSRWVHLNGDERYADYLMMFSYIAHSAWAQHNIIDGAEWLVRC